MIVVGDAVDEKRRLAAHYDAQPAAEGELPAPATHSKETPLSGCTAARRQRSRRYKRIAAVLGVIFGLHTLALHYESFGSLGWHGHRRPHHRPHPPLTPDQREKLFLSVPSHESARTTSKAYANHPHLAGSPGDFDDAKAILKFFQEELHIPASPDALPIFPAGTRESRNSILRLTNRHHGLRGTRPRAWIDVYYPVLNTPVDHSLEILEDGEPVWKADLEEDGDPADEDAANARLAVPAWHGLSKDGSATGQLIYVNYGRKEDYDELEAAGTNFTGKIVLARYGGIFRGLKIKRAEELGATGVLIYSDPRDDGYVTTANNYTAYPHGPARNPTSVQRGSVQYLSSYPGDPTTPGYPAYQDAKREEGTNIPKIPSLPISWVNGKRLLEEIEGQGYDVERKLSGKASAKEVKLVNHVDTKVTPIWNTMATIPGHIRDEVVVIGCHRDAWVLGAADPISGTVTLHEIVRGFGRLLKTGWKPLRTIVIASWDGEEYGLVGSTEWGEDFASWISKHVVAYLNVDVSVSGSQWNIGGSPSLANLIKQTALDVPHPTKEGKTLWDAREDLGPYFAANVTASSGIPLSLSAEEDFMDSEFLQSWKASEKLRKSSSTGIFPLGSGSDYTVFLQRLGVASTDQGFGYTPSDAVYHYHSIYDSHRWLEIYADTDFGRHVAVAKHLGLMALRLVDAYVLPLNTTQYAGELGGYLETVEKLGKTSSPDSGVGAASTINFDPLRKAIANVQEASVALDGEKAEAEKEFRELVDKMRKWPHYHRHRRPPHHPPPHHPPHRGEGDSLAPYHSCGIRGTVRMRLENWVRGVFGAKLEENEWLHEHGYGDGDEFEAGFAPSTAHSEIYTDTDTDTDTDDWIDYATYVAQNSGDEMLSQFGYDAESMMLWYLGSGHLTGSFAVEVGGDEDEGEGAQDWPHIPTRLPKFPWPSKPTSAPPSPPPDHPHPPPPDHPHPPPPDHPHPPPPDHPHPPPPDHPRHPHPPHHRHPLPPFRQLIRAARRIARVNQKLITFERGFISDEGIKDREWYRHLGVAPGKWLGYGATTFPALTEAVQEGEGKARAGYEVGRLVVLLDRLAARLRDEGAPARGL